MSSFVVKDTGLGREGFVTGSVRDKRVGKGRFDLLPHRALLVWADVSGLFNQVDDPYTVLHEGLSALFKWYRGSSYDGVAIMLAAVAAVEYGPPRGTGMAGLQWPAIERWAQLMERGAEKYGEHNWELGQPLSRFFDSGLRHFYQWHLGLNPEEDHMASVFYNLGAIIHTTIEINAGRLPKELDDRPLANKGDTHAES
jgi:hypothetical protein